jgi:hypothetical protein
VGTKYADDLKSAAIELSISVSVDSPHWRYEADDDPRRETRRDEVKRAMSAYTRKKGRRVIANGSSMYRASGTIKVAWRLSFDGVEVSAIR